MVGAGYFALVDTAGGIDALEGWFTAACQETARRLGLPHGPDDATEQWDSYLSGGYGVCLRQVAVDAIGQKARHITTIEELLVRPAPHHAGWAGRLRAVSSLAAIERPGSPLDAPRWGGPMSPHWYGAYLRAYFPQVFNG